MKQVTRYVCETCGTQFNTEEDARRCESFHHALEEVKPIYRPRCSDPYELEVVLSDGEICRYKYARTILEGMENQEAE